MATINQVRDYWNTHIHDLDISTHQPGTVSYTHLTLPTIYSV